VKKKGQQQAETAACGEIRKTFKGIASSSVFLGGQNAVEKVVRDWAYLVATNMTEEILPLEFTSYRTLSLQHSISPKWSNTQIRETKSKTTLLLKERLH